MRDDLAHNEHYFGDCPCGARAIVTSSFIAGSECSCEDRYEDEPCSAPWHANEGDPVHCSAGCGIFSGAIEVDGFGDGISTYWTDENGEQA